MCTAERPNCTGWLTHAIDTMSDWQIDLLMRWFGAPLLPGLLWLLDVEEEPDADAA